MQAKLIKQAQGLDHTVIKSIAQPKAISRTIASKETTKINHISINQKDPKTCLC